ncbi:MAG: N-acetylmuramoyl-L-alanine amidase [Clostridium sp.]
MKIGGRSGHNPKAIGAVGLVNEVTEDRKIFSASKGYLQKKHTFISCYPGEMNGVNKELMWGINRANENKVDLFYSVHLNKAYNRYDGAIGTEIWLHPSCNQDTKNKANRILNNFEKLGFINRGIKYSTQLAELSSTYMEAMIIECFFCEATGDVDLYKKLGVDELGFAIANGIDTNIIKTATIESHRNCVVYANDVDKRAAEYLNDWLNVNKQDSILVDKKDYKVGMGRSVYAVGGGVNDIKSNIHLQGNDRFITLQIVCRKMRLY